LIEEKVNSRWQEEVGAVGKEVYKEKRSGEEKVLVVTWLGKEVLKQI
jgi:hypothetical protein